MRKGLLALALLLLVAGIGIVAYPYIQQERYRRYADNLIAEFETRLEMYREEMIRSGFGDVPGRESGSTDGEGGTYTANGGADIGNGQENAGDMDPFHWLYRQMFDYNQMLYETGQADIIDPFSFEDVDFSLQEFGFRDEMIGFITIPQMNVELPIFLGASYENLNRGAGLIMQTSLPMGGINTNAVIAAHRGLGTAVMFRDIERLQIGDEFFVTNFYQTLRYAVVGTQIISPTDIDAILIQSGRDMVTLFTCHPYRFNHQRYLVFAERVE